MPKGYPSLLYNHWWYVSLRGSRYLSENGWAGCTGDSAIRALMKPEVQTFNDKKVLHIKDLLCRRRQLMQLRTLQYTDSIDISEFYVDIFQKYRHMVCFAPNKCGSWEDKKAAARLTVKLKSNWYAYLFKFSIHISAWYIDSYHNYYLNPNRLIDY